MKEFRAEIVEVREETPRWWLHIWLRSAPQLVVHLPLDTPDDALSVKRVIEEAYGELIRDSAVQESL